MKRCEPFAPALALCGLSLVGACGAADKTKRMPDAGSMADAGSMTDAGSTEPPAIEPWTARITAEGAFLRDEQGRAVLFRGINARVEGVFDVDLGAGRVPLEPIPALTDDDCKQMAAWGINLLRLPIQWSGVEPERDRFDDAYLARVDAAIDCASAAGVAVLVDLHQDAYSKEIGEDGAPLWAIVPPPEMLLEGPLTAAELQRRRFSPEVNAAFETFFDPSDAAGLQAEFLEMLAHVAARYAEHPGLIGIDLFNEPVTAPLNLRSFNQAAAETVRQAAPDKLVLFEPTGPRGYTGSEPAVNPPFDVEGAVYAPHLYPSVFFASEEELLALGEADLRETFDNAAAEAADWQTPWLVGEFGGPASSARDDKYLGLMYKLLDERFISATLWLWKEESQGSWGMFDSDGAGGWTPRSAMVDLVSRPYVERAAGTPSKLSFADATLELTFEDALDAAHRVYVPERLTAATATCNEADVTPTVARDPRYIELRCGAGPGPHVLRVRFE
jgi:endoglycosylceramidase